MQFVGDFGVIPDDPIHEAGMGALGDFYLLLGKSARSSESTFVGSRLFNLKLSIAPKAIIESSLFFYNCDFTFN